MEEQIQQILAEFIGRDERYHSDKLEEAIAKYARRLAALMEQGWVSVENRLPERGVGVLITDGEDMVTAQRLCVGPAKTFTQDNAFWAGYGYGGYDCESEVHEPTHWMPLPATPTEPKE